MRRTSIAILAAVLVSATTAFAGPATSADATTMTSSHAKPPAHPAALTAAQYQYLQVVQTLPEHSRILGTSATYSAREKSLKFTRFSDDFWTVAYDVGWPGAYLTVAICALAF